MTFKHKLSKRLALSRVALMAAVVACAGTDVGSPVIAERDAVALKIHPQQASIPPGHSVTFTPYAFVASGDSIPIPVGWTATGGSITSDGTFQSDSSLGTQVITATPRARPDLAATATVEVVAVGEAILRIHPRDVSIQLGDSVEFSAYMVTEGDSTLTPVEWSATQGMMVSQGTGRGKLKGTGTGDVRIQARGGPKRDSTTVTVLPPPVAAVVVTPASVSVLVGDTVQLQAMPVDAQGTVLTDRTITWASGEAAVVDVDDTGRLAGIGVGTTVVTATCDGQTGTSTVTVTRTPVASVSVSPASTALAVGQAAQLTATPRDSAGNPLAGRTVTWSTSNGGVATVSAGGLVTGVGAGSVTITATSGGVSGAATVTVSLVPVATVSVSPGGASLLVGQTVQLTASPRDSAGNPLAGRTVTWSTSNDGVATVSVGGLVTGVGAGSVTITATSEGKRGTATVAVALVPVAAVTVNPASLGLAVAQTAQLTATLLDSAGNVLSGRTVHWTTSAATVAAVTTSGLVTALAVGNATITASSEGKAGVAGVAVTATAECSSSLANVRLPLCDGTYGQNITSSTFPAQAVIQALNPGKVRFTGSFDAGNDLTFRGIVISSRSQKSLGSGTVYEDVSFVGGPACGNSVNTLSGSRVTIRRSAFYGPGGRYLFLPWHVTGVVLEDVIFRTDGGWGEGGSGCSGSEPNAALNVYDSPAFVCVGCILFDGVETAGAESETLGGLGVNCHESASGAVFENNLIVNSAGGFWADGWGTCDSVVVRNSAAYQSTGWGLKRHVLGTTTAINFSTDANCGGWKGTTTLTASRIGGTNDGCVGGTSGAGASIQLNITFLDDPRWRRELCTDAGVTRGWCGTNQALSAYLRSYLP